ncbi:hypothetical protein HY968_00665 [Candidatus Kaiserbacteria bacterium]|nr:hypothetical protein [Candidatus Kaiserbacteria bacterium]
MGKGEKLRDNTRRPLPLNRDKWTKEERLRDLGYNSRDAAASDNEEQPGTIVDPLTDALGEEGLIRPELPRNKNEDFHDPD